MENSMRKILSFTAALLIAGSALAGGEIWRWKDANGTWHYSDQPQAGAELVRRAGRPATAADSPSPAAMPKAPSPAMTDSGSSPVSNEVAAQVRQEAASAKTDQCKKADEAYQKAVQARRIYKTDESGNKVFMSDAEIDSARLQARSTRDVACGHGD
jgi:hypothetical protein